MFVCNISQCYYSQNIAFQNFILIVLHNFSFIFYITLKTAVVIHLQIATVYIKYINFTIK